MAKHSVLLLGTRNLGKGYGLRQGDRNRRPLLTSGVSRRRDRSRVLVPIDGGSPPCASAISAKAPAAATKLWLGQLARAGCARTAARPDASQRFFSIEHWRW